MSIPQYSAIILGSTGLIGNQVLSLILANKNYAKVYIIVRKKIPHNNPKLIQIQADYHSVDPFIENLQVDHIYSCLGSTKKKTPKQVDYYRIDHEYPLKVIARLARNGAAAVSLVSAIGANPTATNFYLRMKGELEQDLQGIAIPAIHIFRPALLTGDRKEYRLLEKFSEQIFKLLNNLLIGKLKNYKSIQASTVAQAMVQQTLSQQKGIYIYLTEDIKNLA